ASHRPASSNRGGPCRRPGRSPFSRRPGSSPSPWAGSAPRRRTGDSHQGLAVGALAVEDPAEKPFFEIRPDAVLEMMLAAGRIVLDRLRPGFLRPPRPSLP